MVKSRSKKKTSRRGRKVTPALDPLRRGMPAQDSIVEVKEMIRGGTTFRIMKTSEMDEYDQAPRKKGKKKVS